MLTRCKNQPLSKCGLLKIAKRTTYNQAVTKLSRTCSHSFGNDPGPVICYFHLVMVITMMNDDGDGRVTTISSGDSMLSIVSLKWERSLQICDQEPCCCCCCCLLLVLILGIMQRLCDLVASRRVNSYGKCSDHPTNPSSFKVWSSSSLSSSSVCSSWTHRRKREQ